MIKKMLPGSARSLLLLVLFLMSIQQVFGQGPRRKRHIVIEPHSARVQVNDQVQFSATIIERNGQETDTVFTWSVDATGFGEISDNGTFTAVERGKGYVYASAGELNSSAHVSVIDTVCGDPQRSEWSYLEITPADTLVTMGETVQFSAALVDSAGNSHDTTVTWSLRGNQVGTLTADGLFTATDKGAGLIRASLAKFSSTTHILVSITADTASRDTIRIRFRDRDGVMLGDSCRVNDSNIFVIHGLSFPLNVLNGGEIVFPPGSLTEDIEIDISLTEAAIIGADSTVSFADQILNGISFKVYVNGILISPYYFTEPVQLILPYKEVLWDSLGLTEEDLWIFFYNTAGEYNGDGITNIVVDTAMNKIYADIIHFSDLVITSSHCACTGISQDSPYVPRQHRLYANYPNPFNPKTRIAFYLGGSRTQLVTLTIYNMLGQHIRTLVNGIRSPGSYSVTWDGRDKAGRLLSSGIFIYQLKAGDVSICKRMLLIE